MNIKIILSLVFLYFLFLEIIIGQNQAETIVKTYLEGFKNLSAAQMNACLSDHYATVGSDGHENLYIKDLAYKWCDWEKVMKTKWNCDIINVNKDTITAILMEESHYWKLLGLGKRTQVTTYVVESGKINRAFSKLNIELYGTQAEAYNKFKVWLLTQTNYQSEPDLITSEERLIFDGKSAPRMLYWLRKWNKHRKKL